MYRRRSVLKVFISTIGVFCFAGVYFSLQDEYVYGALHTNVATVVLPLVIGNDGPGEDQALTLLTVGQGATAPAAGDFDYPENAVATVTATPDPNWFFSHWSTSSNNAYAPTNLDFLEGFNLGTMNTTHHQWIGSIGNWDVSTGYLRIPNTSGTEVISVNSTANINIALRFRIVNTSGNRFAEVKFRDLLGEYMAIRIYADQIDLVEYTNSVGSEIILASNTSITTSDNTWSKIEISAIDNAIEVRHGAIADTTLSTIIQVSNASHLGVMATGSLLYTPLFKLGAPGTAEVHYDDVLHTAVLEPSIKVKMNDDKTVTANFVQDLATHPVITLLGSSNLMISCGEIYTEAGFTVSDDIYTYLAEYVEVGSALDSSIPGSYSITYDVVDFQGNSASQVTRTVVVADIEAPEISILGSSPITIEYNGTYIDPGATALDICDGDVSENIIVSGDDIDTTQLGTNLVSFVVVDSAGNISNTATRAVDVVDSIAPVITLNGSADVLLEDGALYVEQGATATDLRDGDLSSQISVSGTVDEETAGQYSVHYDVSDTAGNSAETVTRTVVVEDVVPPTLTLEGANPLVIDVGSVFVDPGATAIDQLEGDISANVIVSGDTVATTEIDSFTLYYDVSDAAGNLADQISRTVEVHDLSAPIISLLGENPVNVEYNGAYAEQGATAFDNLDSPSSLTVEIQGGPVTTDQLGTYTLTYDVTDTAGNPASTVTRVVNVVDSTPPVITLTGDSPISLEFGSTYAELGATVTDNVDTGLVATVVGNVDTSVLGEQLISYNVTDNQGNVGFTVYRQIFVVDTTPPELSLVGANPLILEFGEAYSEPGVLATDQVDGDLSGGVVISGDIIDSEALGEYTLHYDISDNAGNAATTMSRLVSVVDTTPPTIQILGNNPMILEYGTPYIEMGATAFDNVQGDLTEAIGIGGAEVLVESLGSYSVTYVVSDAQGNSSEVIRVVEIVDTTAPILALIGEDPIEVPLGAEFIDPAVSAFDQVYGDVTQQVVVGGDIVDTLTIGEYTVTYTVTDPSGNSAGPITRLVVVHEPSPELTVLGPNNGSVVLTPPVPSYVVASGDPNTTNEYAYKTKVRIDAVPDAGYVFWSWGGDLPSERNLTVFDDSFSGPELDSNWNIESGAWSISIDGALRVQSSENEFPILSRTNEADDHKVSYSYKRNSDTGSWWHYLRWENPDNYLLLQISEDHIRLREMNNGLHEYLLVSSELSSDTGEWYELSIECEGNVVRVNRAVAGKSPEEVLSYSGVNILSTQKIAFSTYAGVSFDIDTVLVRNLRDSAFLTMKSSKTVSASFIVEDTTAPVITLIGGMELNISCGTDYIDAGATANDNRYGDITDRILIGGDVVNTSVAGVYNISYNVSDEEGNSAQEVTRTVVVDDDTEAPTISLEGDSIVYLHKGDVYEEAGATAIDVCEGDIDVAIDDSTLATGIFGTYFVNYNAVDSSGNEAPQIQREVRVWPTLSISAIGAGSTNLGLTEEGGALFYAPGTTVVLSPVESDPTWVFDAWSGDGSDGTDNSRIVEMTDSRNVAVKFVEGRELIFTSFGEGSVVYNTDVIISQSETPVSIYLHPSEETVHLTALAVDGTSEFVQWMLGAKAVSYEASTFIDIGPSYLGTAYVRVTFAPIGTVEYFDVTIAVEGSGTTVPAPGIYRVPKFHELRPECHYECQADPGAAAVTCWGCQSDNDFTAVALPSENWIFDDWQAPGYDLLEPEIEHEFSVSGDMTITAKFLERPRLSGLDLLTSMGEFFVDVGEISAISEIYSAEFDWGDLRFEDNGSVAWAGNGIPDAAEISLLLSILVDHNMDHSLRGGVAHSFVWQDFAANQAQATLDLPSQTEHIRNTVAAYMTFGSYGHVGKISELVEGRYGVLLDPDSYKNSSRDLLMPDGDSDGDGVPNQLEWQLVPQSWSGNLSTRVWSFPLWALDQDLPSHSSVAVASSAVSSKVKYVADEPTLVMAGSVVDCDCPEGIPLKGLVTISEHPYLSIGHSISCGTLTLDSPASINLGRSIGVRAFGDTSGTFSYWNAPGTLIHGSGNRSDKFSLTKGGVTVGAVMNGYASLSIKDIDATVSVVRGDASKVTFTMYPNSSNPESILVVGPMGTLISVSKTGSGGWVASAEHSDLDVNTIESSVVCALGYDDVVSLDSLYPFINIFNFPYVRFTHYVSSDGGGEALVGIGDGSGNSGSHHDNVVTFVGQASTRGYWGGSPPSATHQVTFMARPHIGYQLSHWEGIEGKGRDLIPGEWFTASSSEEHLDVKAVFVEKSTIQWRTRGIGASESMPGDCVGFCQVAPAQKYYDVPTATGAPEIIEVKAVAQPGYTFVKWAGHGQAWLDAVGADGEWTSVVGPSEPIDESTEDTIYLKMADSNNGPIDHELFAVYSRDAGDPLSGYKLEVDVLGLGSYSLDPPPDASSGYYAPGDVVTIEAIPGPDYQMDTWGGDVDDGQDLEALSVIVTMNENKRVDLSFDPMWELTLVTNGEGVITHSPDQPNYLTDTTVTATATADPGWQFSKWAASQQGVEDLGSNPMTIHMDWGHKKFTAQFLKERALTVNVAFDDGVTLSPGLGGSVESSTESFVFLDGQTAMLEVYPDIGNVLARWEGPNGAEVTEEGLYSALLMDGDKQITAVFESGHTLNALVDGPGTVSMDPVATAYKLDQLVTVTIHPAPGWRFDIWTGDTETISDVSESSVVVTVTGDQTIRAAVSREVYDLTLLSEGPGMIEALPDADSFPSYETVEIFPTALPGTKFDHWEDGEGIRLPQYSTENPLRLTMDESKTIRGVFRDKAVLHIESSEYIVQEPLPSDDGTYPLGTEVTLTAAPSVGKLLTEWEGDGYQTDYDPLVAKLTMDSDKLVIVSFEDAYLLTVNTITGASATTWPGDAKDYLQAYPRPQFWYRANADMGQSLSDGQFVGYLPTDMDIVTLKARDTVGDGQVFHHWEDDQGTKLSRDLEYEFELQDDTVLNAVYIDQGPRLTVNILGEGQVTINDDLPKEYRGLRAKRNYSDGESVSIHVEPIPGYYFDHWVCSDLSATTTLHDTTGDLELTLTEDTVVSAIFIPNNELIVFDGDVNEDGVTDQADVDVVKSAIVTKSSTHTKADIDGNNDYDLFDLKWAIDAKEGRNQEYTLFLDTQGYGIIQATAPNDPLREITLVNYHRYQANAPVTLHAIPEDGWRFDRWAGATQSQSDTITLTLSRPLVRVYAKFVPIESGEDHTDPDGDGMSTYKEGVYGTDPNDSDSDNDGLPDGWEIDNSLNPNSAEGNHGAEGDQDEDGLSNLQEYQQNTDPLAVGERLFKVFLFEDGDGIVENDLPLGGYKSAQALSVSATEGVGAEFVCWEGDLVGDAKALSPFGVYSHKAIRGTFRSQRTVTVHDDFVDGRWGLDKGDGEYMEGEIAELAATPRPGEKLVGWAGTISGDAEDMLLEVDRDHLILPSFQWEYYTVTLQVAGEGQRIDVAIGDQTPTTYIATDVPIEILVPTGEEVALTAVPDLANHWIFDEWGLAGGESGTETLHITPTGNATIAAAFAQTIPVALMSTHAIETHLSLYPEPAFEEISGSGKVFYYPAGQRVEMKVVELPVGHDGVSWTFGTQGDVTASGMRHETVLSLLWPGASNITINVNFLSEAESTTTLDASFMDIETGVDVGVTQVWNGAPTPTGIIALPQNIEKYTGQPVSVLSDDNIVRLLVSGTEPGSWLVTNKFGDVVFEANEVVNQIVEVETAGAPYNLKSATAEYDIRLRILTRSLSAIGTRIIDTRLDFCPPDIPVLVSGPNINMLPDCVSPRYVEGDDGIIYTNGDNNPKYRYMRRMKAPSGTLASVYVSMPSENIQFEPIYYQYLLPDASFNSSTLASVRAPQGIYLLPPEYNGRLRPPSGADRVLFENRRLVSNVQVNYDFRKLRTKKVKAYIAENDWGGSISEGRVSYTPKSYKMAFKTDVYMEWGRYINGVLVQYNAEETVWLEHSDLPYSSWERKFEGESLMAVPRGDQLYTERLISGPSRTGEHVVTFKLFGEVPTAAQLIDRYGNDSATEVVYPNAPLSNYRDRNTDYTFTLQAADFVDHSEWLQDEILNIQSETETWVAMVHAMGIAGFPGTLAGRPIGPVVSKFIEKVADRGKDEDGNLFPHRFSYGNPGGGAPHESTWDSDNDKYAFFKFAPEQDHKIINRTEVNSILFGAFLRYIYSYNTSANLGIEVDNFDAWKSIGDFERKYVDIGWLAAADGDILDTEHGSGRKLNTALTDPGYLWPPESSPQGYFGPWTSGGIHDIELTDIEIEPNEYDDCRGEILDGWVGAGNAADASLWEDSPVPTLNIVLDKGDFDGEVTVTVSNGACNETVSEGGEVRLYEYEGFKVGTPLVVTIETDSVDYFVTFPENKYPNALMDSKDYSVSLKVGESLDWEETLAFEIKKAGHLSVQADGSLNILDYGDTNLPIVVAAGGNPYSFYFYGPTPVDYMAELLTTQGCFVHWQLSVDNAPAEFLDDPSFDYTLEIGVDYALTAYGEASCNYALDIMVSDGGSVVATLPGLADVTLGALSSQSFSISSLNGNVVNLAPTLLYDAGRLRWVINGQEEIASDPNAPLIYTLAQKQTSIAAIFEELLTLTVRKDGPGEVTIVGLDENGVVDPGFTPISVTGLEKELVVPKADAYKIDIVLEEDWRIESWSDNLSATSGCVAFTPENSNVTTAYLCTPGDGDVIEIDMEFDPIDFAALLDSLLLSLGRNGVSWGGTTVSNMPPALTDTNWADPSSCPIGQQDFSSVGDPVYPYSGEVYLNEVDFRIPNLGAGPDFVWSRSYRSRFGENTDLGNGWDYSYNISVEEVGPSGSTNSVLLLRSGNGRRDYFDKATENGETVWKRPEHFTKIIKEDGSYKVVYNDGSFWRFNSLSETELKRGRILEIVGRLGHFISFDYYHPDPNSTRPEIKIAGGWRDPSDSESEGMTAYEVRVVYNQSHLSGTPKGWYISELRDGNYKVVDYETNSAGALESANIPNHTAAHFSYTPQNSTNPELGGNLLTITDGRGNTFVENTYYTTTDTENPNYDRIDSQRWGNAGDVIDFTYAPQTPTVANRNLATKTTISDRRGNVKILYYDIYNRGLREDIIVENDQGQDAPLITRQYWDEDSLLERRELPNGVSERYYYDKDNDESRYRGRMLRQVILPASGVTTDTPYMESRYAYGDQNCGCADAATDMWDTRGAHTEFVYNDQGNMEATIYPDGTTSTFSYVESGLFTGRLERQQLPENESGHANLRRWQYTTPNAYTGAYKVYEWNGGRYSQREYSLSGNLRSSTDAEGNTTYFKYDNARVLQRPSEIYGELGDKYGLLFEFDENRNLISSFRGKIIGPHTVPYYASPLFDTEDWQYTEYTEYDILNRLKQEKRYNGGTVSVSSGGEVSHSGGEAIVTELDYDPNGNVIQIRSGEATRGAAPDNLVDYQYDERNYVTQVKRGGNDAKAITTTFEYDEIGSIIEKTVGDQTRVFSPDGYGRIKTAVDSMGNYTTTTYDSVGNVSNILLEGELVDENQAVNNTMLANVDVEYDVMNRPVRRTIHKFDPSMNPDPALSKVQTNTQYNALGQPIVVTDDTGFETSMSYNYYGELETIQQGRTPGAYVGSLTEFLYDNNGNIASWEKRELSGGGITNPVEKRSATYGYNAANLPLWTFSGGKKKLLHYDSRGNVTQVEDAEGNEFYYTYDNLNRLLSASTEPDPNDPTIFSQDWDHNNRMIFKKDGDGNQTDYAYDALNRVKQVNFPGLAQGGGRPFEVYGYDALGRLETRQDRNGATVTMHYDRLNRLTQRDFVAASYDHPVFTNEYFEYDGLSRMVEARNDYSKVLLHYDSMSNMLSESLEFIGGTAPAGPFEVSHEFDSLGRPTSMDYPGGRSLDYSYNMYNQDLSQISEGGQNLVNYGYYTRDTVARKNLGPEVVTGSVQPEQYYPGSWDDYMPVTQPAASVDFGFRNTGGGVNPTHRLVPESLGLGFNRTGGGAGAGPGGGTPVSYDDRVISHTWDQNFNKQSTLDEMPGFIPSPRASSYTYDALDRLSASTTVNSAATSSMALDYGDLGRLGNRDTVTLTSDDYPSGEDFEPFVIDPNGVDPNAYSSTATSHPDFARTQSYDDNGNLTTIEDGVGGMRALGYDPNDRLVVHSATSGLTTRYRYDALGRRIETTVVHDPNDATQDEVTRFLYSGHRVIEERDDSAAVLASYVYGRGLDEVVSMQRDVVNGAGAFVPDEVAENYFYLADTQNNTLILTDAEGQMVEAYAYGTELRPYVHLDGGVAQQYPNDFGMPAILDETGAVLHADFTKTGMPTHIDAPDDVTAGSPYASRYGNPYLFNGRRWDSELGLYYYRNRHLDPIQGRFTTLDPIGRWGDPMNLGNGYSYVGNNPWTYVDPFGLQAYPETGLGWTGYYTYETLAGAVTIPRLMLEGFGGALQWGFGLLFPGRVVESRDYPDSEVFLAQLDGGNSQYVPGLQGDLERSYNNTLGQVRNASELAAIGIYGPLGTAIELGSAGTDAYQGNYLSAALPITVAGMRVCPSTVRRVTNAAGDVVDSSRFVYRGLAEGEDLAAGILARAPDVEDVSPLSHVAGLRKSPWISTTKDLNVALDKYGEHGVVMIDLDLVSSSIVDLSDGIPNGGRMSNWAIRDQEVLVHQQIPPEAILGLVAIK